VVTGGLSAGGASYFGGALSVLTTGSAYSQFGNFSGGADRSLILSNARVLNFDDSMIARNLVPVTSSDSSKTLASTAYAGMIYRYDGNIDWVANSTSTAGASITPTVRMSLSNAGALNVTGAATFAGAVTANGTLNANSAGSNVSLAANGTTVQSGIIVQANTGFVFFSDYATVTKGIKVDVNNGGLTILSGALTTATPTGGTAKPWKVGEAATVSPTSPNRTIRVEIDGTVYFLAAKTTND